MLSVKWENWPWIIAKVFTIGHGLLNLQCLKQIEWIVPIQKFFQLILSKEEITMYEELVDLSFDELCRACSVAFYSGYTEHAETLAQEIQWRVENTFI